MNILILLSIVFSLQLASAEPNLDALTLELKNLDEASSGELGVYFAPLSGKEGVVHNATRDWYLSSTVKVPVAVVLLRKVERGEISLDQEVTLKSSDWVDGMGPLLIAKPGTSFKVSYLLEAMLRDSDSTATDLLIRLIGENNLNKEIAKMAEGFHPFSTLLQVRYDAYSEIHANARNLTSQDFLDLKKLAMPARYQEFLKRAKVAAHQTRAKSIPEAFENYYRKKKNSGTLVAFGTLLKKLGKGELLNKSNTNYLLSTMERINTGKDRIKAGLGDGLLFSHKTGTQIARMCNVGLIRRKSASPDWVVAACVEHYKDAKEAERTLAGVGKAISSRVIENAKERTPAHQL